MKQTQQSKKNSTQRPFELDAQFLGQSLFPYLRAMPSFVNRSLWRILADLGLDQPEDDGWYPVSVVLDFYDRLLEEYGPHTLFDLGKSIPDIAVFPPDIQTLEQALSMLNTAYNMNHRNGYLGFYKMAHHDVEKREISMQCYNPCPADLDRGLLTGLARKYANMARVTIDTSKPKVPHETWYLITYN